jgi:hypothetical protein
MRVTEHVVDVEPARFVVQREMLVDRNELERLGFRASSSGNTTAGLSIMLRMIPSLPRCEITANPRETAARKPAV